jgi:UDP-glucose-4-epimerase GalE
MNVLVTGGAGYIGSHTAKALAASGIRPITYDNLSTGHEWAVQWGPLVRGDLSDQRLLRATLRKYDIKAVLHFAALSAVGESVHHPRKYYGNNLVNTIGLLDAMLDSGVDKIIFSSTCATYGDPRSDFLDETHPQAPVNPYGESKLAIERALHWYGEAYDLKFVTLRYFNAAGADEEGKIGEQHDPETHLIPLIFEAVLDPAHPIHIFGTDYPTPDGTAIRDYVHVADLADAHVLGLKLLETGGAGGAFNLGSGRGYSVREVIAAVERITATKVVVVETGRRKGDPPRLVASGNRASQVLKWRPRRDLEQIVSTAWRWRVGFASRQTSGAVRAS